MHISIGRQNSECFTQSCLDLPYLGPTKQLCIRKGKASSFTVSLLFPFMLEMKQLNELCSHLIDAQNCPPRDSYPEVYVNCGMKQL